MKRQIMIIKERRTGCFESVEFDKCVLDSSNTESSNEDGIEWSQPVIQRTCGE